MTMREQSDRTIEEVKEAMKTMSIEEVKRWLVHVTNNPYRVGDISERIEGVLGEEIERREGL